MSHRRLPHRLGLGMALVAAVHAHQAGADTPAPLRSSGTADVETIVVTARKAPERVLDTPLAISVMTSSEIAASGLSSTLDLITRAPNVAASGGIAGLLQGQIAIRGNSTLVRNIGLESGTSLFIDGVYAGRPENFAWELLDIEQVEIARGPQGTAFGKNTVAGLINVRSREPSGDPFLLWRLQAGNYDYLSAQLTANGPLAENLAASLSAGYSWRDGFYRHQSGGRDADGLDLLSWRAAAKFTPSPALTLILRGDGLRDRGAPGFFQAKELAGLASFPSDAPHRINNNRPNRLSRDGHGVSLTADVDFADFHLTAITAYRDSSYRALLDDDQEQVDFVAADDFGDKSELFSQELRASGGSGKWKYLLGAYYFDQRVSTARKLALGGDLGIAGEPALFTGGRVATRSAALFGRVDYSPVDPLTLSIGLRYTRETKKALLRQRDPTGVFALFGFPDLTYADRSTASDWSPTISLTFKPAANASLFLRYARSFKSAAYNIDLAATGNGLAAGPESANSLEAGIKAELFDRRLWLDFTAFHVVYDNLQVSQLLGGGVALSNAGKAKAVGLEAEAAFSPFESLRLQASAGLLDATFDRFENCGVPLSLGGGAADCSGNDLVLAPELSAHFAAEWSIPVKANNIFARVDVDHRSSVYFEPTNAARFKGRARTVIDLRAGFRRSSLEIGGWVRNLTGSTYETYMDDRTAIGLLRTAAYGAPRAYGLSVGGRF